MKKIIFFFLSFVIALIQSIKGQNNPDTLLYLKFDNSMIGKHGEIPLSSTGISYVAGKINQAVNLTAGSSITYDKADNFEEAHGTLEFWVNPNNQWLSNQEYTILEIGGSGGMIFEKDGANNLRLIINRFAINSQPEVDVAYNVWQWDLTKWYHVAYTWGADSLKLYVNGQLVDYDTYTGYTFPVIPASEFMIGDDHVHGEGPLRAYLDEFYIYDSIKTGNQILQDYQTTVGKTCSTLLHLKFDNSLIGEDGEVPLYSSSGISYVSGALQQGIDLTGSRYIDYEKNNNFDEKEGTLEFWVNPNNQWLSNQEYTILEIGGSGGMIFEKDGANNLRLIINRFAVNGQPEVDVAYNVWQWDLSKWYHVAYTWGNDSLKLYVNGILVNYDTYTGYTFPTITASSFRIGDDHIHGEGPLRAYLDDLKIGNCVKTPEEINQDYLDGLPTSCNSLLHLRFDNTTDGEDGEIASTATGINYISGKIDQGVFLDGSSSLIYEKANNFDEKEGTLEFWINPDNNWVSYGSYVIMEIGGAGGMIFAKDGANNLRLMVNRYSVNGQPEVDVAYNVWQWDMSKWYHVAYTWGNDSLKLYVNGILVDYDTYYYPFPTITASQFRIGADGLYGSGAPANAYLDDLNISGCIKSSNDIFTDYNTGLHHVASTTEALNVKNNLLNIHPVPAEDFINIDLSGIQDVVRVEIISQLGNVVKMEEKNVQDSLALEIGALPAGFYMVTVYTLRDKYVSKFLKK